GMELAERQGVTQLIVESDSKVLIDMVTGNCNLNGATSILICRIQDLISRNWQIQFKHMRREGNRCAYWLANYSFTHNSFDVMMLETPPRELQSILFDDIYGTCMLRIVCIVP
ncbi:ribonuclease H protein, partial [Trifolium medium]|nr:ribonuclease H protein [Trifolium medium]